MADERVLDASAAAIFFGEPEGPQLMAELSDAVLFAPRLIDYEMANIALMKERRGSVDVSYARSPRPRQAGDPDIAMLPTVFELAAWDTHFIWLDAPDARGQPVLAKRGTVVNLMKPQFEIGLKPRRGQHHAERPYAYRRENPSDRRGVGSKKHGITSNQTRADHRAASRKFPFMEHQHDESSRPDDTRFAHPVH